MSVKKILVLALVLRLILLYIFRNIDNYDLQSYQIVGNLTLQKINIYPEKALLYHPYFPFFLYIEALSVLLKNFINPLIFLKLIIIFFDVLNVYLVYLLSKKNLKTGLIYAVNPVTVLVSAVHGQFDSIPLFFLLLTVWLIQIRKELPAVFSFSLAILVKTWPVFFLLIIFKKIKNKKLIMLTPIFPSIAILLYKYIFGASPGFIIRAVAGYRSLFNFWGIGKLVSLIFYPHSPQPPIFLQKIFLLVFLAAFFWYSFCIKSKKLTEALFYCLLFFYVFTVGFSIHYLSWTIPFLLIKKPRFWLLSLICMTFYLITTYSLWIVDRLLIKNVSLIMSFATWASFIFLFGSLRKKSL